MDELLKNRELIENSLRQSIHELEELGVSPEDSLLDSEGFPRVDIDLYRVRSLRSSISRQQNDYKAVMKLIEEMLPQAIPPAANQQANNTINTRTHTMNFSLLKPFAKIGIVPIDSLAYKSGLCTNDLILRFGLLNYDNFTGLNDFVTELSAGKDLEIIVRRGEREESIHLIGSGSLLGCQILPLSK